MEFGRFLPGPLERLMQQSRSIGEQAVRTFNPRFYIEEAIRSHRAGLEGEDQMIGQLSDATTAQVVEAYMAGRPIPESLDRDSAIRRTG